MPDPEYPVTYGPGGVERRSLRGRLGRGWTLLKAGSFREIWWLFLEEIEGRDRLRRALFAVLLLVVVSLAAWFLGYPWWTRYNVVRISRQWINAGRLDYAAEVVQSSLLTDPGRPEVLRLAAEISRRRQFFVAAMGYSQQAAARNPGEIAATLEWASDALLANLPDEAERALGTLLPAVRQASAAAQRIEGETARRRRQLSAALDHFENALRIDGPVPVDEVPLGLLLIHSRLPAERARGLSLLGKWAGDLEWGTDALRALLADALEAGDFAAMEKWAEILRAHPRCTLGDIPDCLLALSRANESRFQSVLATLEKKHAADGAQAALLVGWLNRIGRSVEAGRWVATLPPGMTRQPPLVLGVAEALRQTSSWPELAAWTEGAYWGRDLEFLRLAYGMQAARGLGRADQAAEFWRTLQGSAKNSGTQTFFAANTVYAWGWQEEGVALYWSAATQPVVAVEALGALARHFQAQHDGAGQYRVFSQLYGLRASDPAVANNYAFFATLAGSEKLRAKSIARENLARAPGNPVYLATYAFVLFRDNQSADALTVLRPVAETWPDSPAVAFAYGLALAGSGRKEEARRVLASLDPASLTTQEIELVRAASN